MSFKTLALLASVVAANPLAIIDINECGTDAPHKGIRDLATKVNAAKLDAAASAALQDAIDATISVPVYVHVIANDETSSGGYITVC